MDITQIHHTIKAPKNMTSSELTLALIASLTSLVVAIVSLVTALLSNRELARSERSLEQMGFEQSRIQTTEALADLELFKTIALIDGMIASMQITKDCIRELTWCFQRGKDTSEAISELNDAIRGMSNSFAGARGQFDDMEFIHVHDVNRLGAELHFTIGLWINDVASSSAEGQQVLANLDDAYKRLTDHQQAMRDSRISRLTARLEKAVDTKHP